MCCFSQPVIAVNNTRIFARLTSRQTQFLVYEMHYESLTDNAMILPVPVRQPANDQSLRFIDMQDYTSFFDDLDKGFPAIPPTFNIGCSARVEFSMVAGEIPVIEVGNYIASFVPRLSDFSRLNPRFTLPENVWSRMPQYADYGFAVFQLKAGSTKPHPMAFEFESDHNALYFPTVHIHDGEIHETEEFDHTLYMQHAGFDSRVYAYQNWDIPDRSTGLIRSQDVAREFCDVERANGVVAGDLLVHRRFIVGRHPNRDTNFVALGDPVRPTLNLRPLLSYAPWAILGTAVAWFLARRARLRHKKAVAPADQQPPAPPEESNS